MKKYIICVVLFALLMAFSVYGVNITNGTFYTDDSIEYHLISQSGATVSNILLKGDSYKVGESIIEITTTNKTCIYFSGGLMIDIASNSVFSINLFDQEIKNMDSMPCKAEFGYHNINLTFTRGEFSVIYPNSDINLSIAISTPFSSYQLNGGKYFMRISDKSAIAYVAEGSMQVHNDKQVNKTDKGKMAVAIPFVDPASGIEDKVITNIKPIKTEDTDKFTSPIFLADPKKDNVSFFIINGKVVGVWME